MESLASKVGCRNADRARGGYAEKSEHGDAPVAHDGVHLDCLRRWPLPPLVLSKHRPDRVRCGLAGQDADQRPSVQLAQGQPHRQVLGRPDRHSWLIGCWAGLGASGLGEGVDRLAVPADQILAGPGGLQRHLDHFVEHRDRGLRQAITQGGDPSAGTGQQHHPHRRRGRQPMDVGEELRQRRRCGRGFHHDQDGVPDLLQHRSGAGLAAGSQPGRPSSPAVGRRRPRRSTGSCRRRRRR